ncbi:porin family protein [Roseivirga echinicomitans]|uniref:Uncharacterized protein n=1 Tax=Roseivirga echinicomitans TaxID=296218 RepID=A0A150XUF2_9BACT|nr:carboxypeptidase-like regulatory domain-containing protein [Roseivirga echinicomitans]KYG82255.1 hypothetical protein AWN68_15550 [Roseivirga echinicomitans]
MFNTHNPFNMYSSNDLKNTLGEASERVTRVLFIMALLISSLQGMAQSKFQAKAMHKTEAYKAGTRHTLAFEITNLTSATSSLSSKLELPANWNVITQPSVVQLKSQEKSFILYSFSIPTNEVPGLKKAYLELFNEDLSDSERTEIDFKVGVNHDIQVTSLTTPQYTQAGELIEVSFEIKNKGNVNEKIELSSRNNIEGDLIREIPANSSIVIKVNQKTNAKTYAVQSLLSDLKVLNKATEVSKTAYATTKVFPTKIAKQDAYLRYPMEASLYYNNYSNKNVGFSSAYVELRGNGFLDQKQNHYLNFIVRGPNQNHLSRFGINDQYSLIYRNRKNTTVFIGDHVFNINQLGLLGRFGFGARIDQKVNNWVLSAFYTKPRLVFNTKEPIFGGKAVYNASEFLKLGLSFSSSKEVPQYYNQQVANTAEGNGTIAVFEADYQDSKTQVRMELATSMNSETMDYATDVAISHKMGNLFYNGSTTMAGENYFGTLNNSLRYANSLSYNLSKWSLGVGQGYSKVHERVDTTLYGVRPTFENYYASAGYRINSKHFVNLRAVQRMRKDESERQSFDYREKGIDYRYKYTGNYLTVNFNGRIAKTQNLISDNMQARDTYGEFLNVNYKATSKLSLRTNVSHNRTNRYNINNSVSDYYLFGGAFNYRASRDLRFGASYNSGFSPEESYRKRDFINANVLASIGKHHQIEARVNYYMNPNSETQKELFAFVKYTFRFGAPLKKTLKQGGVKGFIKSNDPSINLKGIQVVAAGNSVRSSSKGEFELNNLPVGLNYLLIDESTLPLGVVALAQKPIEVNVAEKITTAINITLVKAKQLKGKLVVTNANQEYQLDGYLKLENNNFTYYIESDKAGNFKFSKIVPGTYKLSLVRLTSEGTLEAVSKELTIQTTNDELTNVEFALKAKERNIKFKSNNFKIGN